MTRKLTALLLAILMLPFSAMNTLAEGEPDLSINEISFSDDNPTGGDTVTIIAEIIVRRKIFFIRISNGT